eukprot:7817793-Pyramimonas_sp.AAC.1
MPPPGRNARGETRLKMIGIEETDIQKVQKRQECTWIGPSVHTCSLHGILVEQRLERTSHPTLVFSSPGQTR